MLKLCRFDDDDCTRDFKCSVTGDESRILIVISPMILLRVVRLIRRK